jgi:glycosyltransferase involved in cell wall biosynthesis
MISIVVISKDEPALDGTLTGVSEQASSLGEPCEVIVVDASRGRLDGIRQRHPEVRWIDYEPPPGVRVSIPHQRNTGVAAAAGELIAFTDAGCLPKPGWLEELTAPLRSGEEHVTAGISVARGGNGLYDTRIREGAAAEYRDECPTINMAFRRAAFDAAGGFDESFEYGSDIDFSWRLVEAGLPIRSVRDSVVEHDWGDHGRQVKRGYLYGRARAHLYRKHPGRLRRSWRRDPMVFVYPAFLVGLPLTLLFPLYPTLLLIPAWRNREDGALRVLADHLAFGIGVLAEVVKR